jgi:hypothetical protein
MSLCKSWHFLGIKRYSTELIWFGRALGGFAFVVGGTIGRWQQVR